MYAKNGLAITEASALKEKLDSLKIYEDESMTIDASMADWTEAMKTNPVKIPATDGREVTIYATLGADGVYIFADAIVNSFRTDGNWWDSTNVEFRLGNEGNQRFASAKATSCSSSICKYLGITLFPQAGVALGMCAIAAANLPGEGALIRNITLFAVLIYEIFGPLLTRMALTAAGDIKPMEDHVKNRRKIKLAEANNK